MTETEELTKEDWLLLSEAIGCLWVHVPIRREEIEEMIERIKWGQK